eukprot:scaffold1350_cov56-Cyclotella_meneghiniana.AAC.35
MDVHAMTNGHGIYGGFLSIAGIGYWLHCRKSEKVVSCVVSIPCHRIFPHQMKITSRDLGMAAALSWGSQ